MRLIFRFYDIGEHNGSIKIDGVDVRDATQESVRRCAAVVPQDTVLFNDTLEHNIAYGGTAYAHVDAHDGSACCGSTEFDPVTYDTVVEVAKRARLHDTIAGMPQGYATVVGERGLKLSGGEKQRVAIARALLKVSGGMVGCAVRVCGCPWDRGRWGIGTVVVRFQVCGCPA
jgi:ATP-binding cassette subfamily B protein